MKNAAIYARVSSDKQREENTIASQTAALIAFASEQRFEVPREWIFEDDGYSGASLIRPGLERVRDLAAEGLIQAVLVYAPDRLSRRYAHQILLIEELARAGVETLADHHGRLAHAVRRKGRQRVVKDGDAVNRDQRLRDRRRQRPQPRAQPGGEDDGAIRDVGDRGHGRMLQLRRRSAARRSCD